MFRVHATLALILLATCLTLPGPHAHAQDALYDPEIAELLGLSEDEFRHYAAGIHAHDDGRFAEARDHYRLIFESSPEHATALYQIAYAYQAEGLLQECATYAGKSAAQASAVQFQALGMEGACLDMAGRHREALVRFAEAIAINPDHALLYHSAAIVHINLGEFEAAIDSLFVGLQVDPFHAGSHFLLSNLRLDRNERAAALLGFSFFLLLEPYSQRSEDAIAAIRYVLAPPEAEIGEDGRTQYSLFIPAGGNEELRVLETLIAITSSARTVLEDESARTEIEHLVRQFEMIFGALPDVEEDVPTDDPVWTLYIPLLAELHAAGHTKAFVYLALEASGLEGIDSWLVFNEDAVEAFFDWLDE